MDDKAKKVILDADACPRSIKEIAVTLAKQYSREPITVASFNHNITGEHRHVMVDDGPQAADMAVMKLTCKGDIVVTQDWGLAALILGKGAQAISPKGIIYDDRKMDFLLEERYLKAEFRRKGGRTKGPSPWRKEDDERFKYNMEKLLRSHT